MHIHNSGLELIDCCRLQKSSRVAGKCYVRVLKNNISLWQTHTTTEKRQILCVMSELYDNYKNDKRDSLGITIAEKQLGVRIGTRSDLEHFPLLKNNILATQDRNLVHSTLRNNRFKKNSKDQFTTIAPSF